MNLLKQAASHSGRGNHSAAQAANARAMKAMAQKNVDDPLAIPDFLKRKKDPKSRAAYAAAWDSVKVINPVTLQPVKVNWLKPRSISDEEFNAFITQQELKKKAKLEKFKAKITTKVDPTGKRWDAMNNRWVDLKTGEVAKPVHEEMKAVRQAAKAASKERKAKAQAEKAARAAIPADGILAEFQCRPDTNRARLLLTLEASINKLLTGEQLSKAVYGTADKLGPLVMVIKGAKETITKLKLAYELKEKAGEAWGLFKAGAAVTAEPKKAKAKKATKKGKHK